MYIVGSPSTNTRQHTVHRVGGALRRRVAAARGGARQAARHRGPPRRDRSPEHSEVSAVRETNEKEM